MAVDSKEFAEYFRKLYEDAKSNGKRSHICLSCWTLVSKAGLYKHRKSGHEVLDNFKISSIEQIVGLASTHRRLTTANGQAFTKSSGVEEDITFKGVEPGDLLSDYKGAQFPPFDTGKSLKSANNYVDMKTLKEKTVPICASNETYLAEMRKLMQQRLTLGD